MGMCKSYFNDSHIRHIIYIVSVQFSKETGKHGSHPEKKKKGGNRNCPCRSPKLDLLSKDFKSTAITEFKELKGSMRIMFHQMENTNKKHKL